MKSPSALPKIALVLLAAGVVVAFLGEGVWRKGILSAIGLSGTNQETTSLTGALPGMPQAVPVSAPPLPVGGEGNAAYEGLVAPNYVPLRIELFEAHWQGMDTRLLTAELRQKLKYPRDLKGILIGEVSLQAAASGFLAGDVVIEVEGKPVATLEEFQAQTRVVRNQTEANVVVLRKAAEQDRGRYAMRRLALVLRGSPDLGFAQVEAAPMILAGAPRPHAHRGPCTNCHAIGSGFELTPDPGMITLPPPPISSEAVAKNVRPHEDHGPCKACHIIR